MAASERNCMARKAVKVTPRAPSWGAWKRILNGMLLPKSVMSESFGRGFSKLRIVRTGRRRRGYGINAGGVEERMVKE